MGYNESRCSSEQIKLNQSLNDISKSKDKKTVSNDRSHMSIAFVLTVKFHQSRLENCVVYLHRWRCECDSSVHETVIGNLHARGV